MPIRRLELRNFKPARDIPVLQSMKQLESVDSIPILKFIQDAEAGPKE